MFNTIAVFPLFYIKKSQEFFNTIFKMMQATNSQILPAHKTFYAKEIMPKKTIF
jgi:hypothetical protein